MFDIALGIFLFLSPIINLISKNARLNGEIMSLQFYQFGSLTFTNTILQYQFFEYGVIALFILSLALKPRREFKNKYLALFLGLAAISVVLHPKTLSAFTPVFLGCLFFYIVYKYSGRIKWLTYVIMAVALLNTVVSLTQIKNVRIDGLMYISSNLGAYQAITTPLFYAIHPLLTIIPVIGMALSKSYTALFALIIGLGYLWFPQRKRIIGNMGMPILLVIVTLCGVFFIRNYHQLFYKFSLRLDLWLWTIKEIFLNPFGKGLGTFSRITEMGQWQWAYNEYLGAMWSLGIITLPVVIFQFKDIFKQKTGFNRIIASSCLIILVICLSQSILHFPRMAGTVIPLLAFLDITRREVC